MSTNPLADGIYFERPKEGRPPFVKGHISIKAEKAIAMINQYKNEKDYVNLDLLESKDKTKLYLVVNIYKKEDTAQVAGVDAIDEEGIPF